MVKLEAAVRIDEHDPVRATREPVLNELVITARPTGGTEQSKVAEVNETQAVTYPETGVSVKLGFEAQWNGKPG